MLEMNIMMEEEIDKMQQTVIIDNIFNKLVNKCLIKNLGKYFYYC